MDTLFQTSRPFLNSRSSHILPQAQTSPCTTKRVTSHTSLRHIFNTSLTSSTVRYHSYTPEDIAGGYGRMPLIRNGEQQTRFSTGRRCRQPSQICSWQQRDFEVTAKSKDQLSSPYRQSIRQPQWQAESQAFDIIGGKLIPG